jgi:hypothetical protein
MHKDNMPLQVCYGDILREKGIEAFASATDVKMPTFIKFTFVSNFEAKNRATIVALLTAKYLKGRNNFIHMFTSDMLALKPTNCLKRINKIGGRIISTAKPGEEFSASLTELH